MKDLDKYRGCLIDGAVGDALGYAIEFLDETSIFKRYGKNGITEYDLVEGVAEISDDTQMTLFTANGLLLGTTRGMTRGIMITYASYIAL
ncbi:MAG: ADP-ribosylglycohydrolase family protein [Lachnospiraceae bacterium]|nr:ADP-ribosylglycohydrolase family protein [Lachnospiraceae bacterium]MDE6252057.1 ADP-ribosylglycohydrolase family protein [Lachnospiraceae bacterium]